MEVFNCRICNGKLNQLISFGKIALVGSFLKFKFQKERKYNLSLAICKKCKHFQIKNIVNPNLLFYNYLWETSVSKTNIKLINEIISKLKKKHYLNKKSKVLEIASNDGTLLNIIKKKEKCFVLGIDPAKNLSKKSVKKGIKTISKYFSFQESKRIITKYQKFDYCIARNVIAHTKNPNDIFKGINNILNPRGICVLEVPHLLNIIKQNQYDNIFHEHIGFHSLKSIIDLCDRNKLKILDVEKIDSQGGSIRCYISKLEYKKKINIKVSKLINMERKKRIFEFYTAKKFVKKIKLHITEMKKILSDIKLKNKKISVYGASGKGSALMQFCKIDSKLVDNVFDKSKLKQGKYTPGSRVKILDPKNINSSRADYLLILSWNLKKEIIKQEWKFKEEGGKFIIPFPKPKIIK